MNKTVSLGSISSWVFALLLVVVGILNVVLVHPVPGVAYLLLSILYFPPVINLFQERIGFSIPPVIKVVLGILLILFTLGVSDLGDMIDKL